MKSKLHEGPLKVNADFDDAIKRALTVKPPKGGWASYEAKLRRRPKSKTRKAR